MSEPADRGRRSRPSLNPRLWPVRWRLAGVSAGLTLLILVIFALVVGRLATNRIRGDFYDDLRGTAATFAAETQVSQNALAQRFISPPDVRSMALAPNSHLRLVDAAGHVVQDPQGRLGQTRGAPDLGPPDVEHVRDVGSYSVAAYPVPATINSGDPIYVQYARSEESVNTTIARLWLFLALGVAGGTGLALIAGLAVAGRAMAPVGALTAAARKIAATRDPSRKIPQPEADDEIAELARTLDEMLRELDAARSETEQMVQAQREFVADASHELRTPLTSILANLELLQAHLESGGDGDESETVGSALRSSRRMSRLVSDLLLLARADAGRVTPRRECDLREIAAAAVSEVTPVAEGRRLTLAGNGPVPVECDPDELHRLAVNLLDNGVRHTPAGSSIEVTVGKRNGHAVLEVADDGPGLPAELGDQVFGRFVRGEGPNDTKADTGTGLGLAIVKAVAISHGGDVEAGVSPAGGARFTVELPMGNS